jgi:cyclohexanecarboxyl-CoA dehydrogenase
MISFAFTQEQEDFRKELRRFAKTELAPKYSERAAKAEFPWEAHRQLADLGVLGIGLPEKYGGMGDLDPITLGIATEALAYGDVNVAAAPVQVGLVAAQLAVEGRESVVEEYVPALINGEIVAAIAVTEPSAGSDASNLRMEARPVEGGWKLNGEKIAITHAMHAKIALVYASTKRWPGQSSARPLAGRSPRSRACPSRWPSTPLTWRPPGGCAIARCGCGPRDNRTPTSQRCASGGRRRSPRRPSRPRG